MSNATMSIARTIQQQIGTNRLMCIGAHQFVALPETDSTLGGLRFKINPNPKLRVHATVEVILDPSDTYTVRIVTCRGKVALDTHDIYCDMLGEVIEGVTG